MIISQKILTPRVPHYMSPKVIGTDTDWSAIDDFLVIHRNYVPISDRFRDERQYFQNFPTAIRLAPPLWGFSWNFATAIGLIKLECCPHQKFKTRSSADDDKPARRL